MPLAPPVPAWITLLMAPPGGEGSPYVAPTSRKSMNSATSKIRFGLGIRYDYVAVVVMKGTPVFGEQKTGRN